MALQRPKVIRELAKIPRLGRIVRLVYDLWVSSKFKLYWRYLRNPPSRRLFKAHPPVLSQAQRRIVKELLAHGIAIACFSDLFYDEQHWRRLNQIAQEFAGNMRTLVTQVNAGVNMRTLVTQVNAGADLNRPDAPAALQQNQARVRRYTGDAKGINRDDYILKLFPDHPVVTLDDPLLKLALAPPILDVVNSYLNLWAKLLYFDMWHTIPAGSRAELIGSQRWHRDPEDRRMLKVYLYFSEVNEGAGPMYYLPGSRVGEPYQHLGKWASPAGYASPPHDEIERSIQAADVVSCIGGPGTLIFCDTNGLHHGSLSTAGVRLAATWTFVTPASLWPRRFKVADSTETTDLSAAAKFALSE